MRDGFFVDVEPISDECKGNACLLGFAGIADKEIEIDTGINRRTRVFLGIHVAAGTLQHHTEWNGSLGHG